MRLVPLAVLFSKFSRPSPEGHRRVLIVFCLALRAAELSQESLAADYRHFGPNRPEGDAILTIRLGIPFVYIPFNDPLSCPRTRR